MQNRQKALNLIGLSQKAGKLVSGFEIVSIGVKARKVKLIILAHDTQADTTAKISKIGKQNNVPVITEFNSSEISQAIGKKRKVLGITDAGFGKAMLQKIKEGV